MKDSKTNNVEYINTPFNYTRQQQGLTLLQQNIMNRISAHLQGFFSEYWHNAQLRSSKDVPRTFMTDEQIQEMKPIRIELSELGISSGTYDRVSDARNAILNIKLNGIVVDDATGANDRTWNVISRIDIPITDHGTTVMKKARIYDEEGKEQKVGEAKATETQRYRGYMDIYLTPDLVTSMLAISCGYVTHPENIASIGRVPNMPLMYYFIRHHMNNFKSKDGNPVTSAKVELSELRDYLGMTKRNARGEVVQEKYATYSQFKSKVIDVALADIRRVYEEGLIDFYFDVREIRPRGKQRGTPSYLVFEKRQTGAAPFTTAPDLFDTPSTVYTDRYVADWSAVMADYNGPLRELLQRGTVLGTPADGYLTIAFSSDDMQILLPSVEWEHLREQFKQRIGMRFGPGVQITKASISQ